MTLQERIWELNEEAFLQIDLMLSQPFSDDFYGVILDQTLKALQTADWLEELLFARKKLRVFKFRDYSKGE